MRLARIYRERSLPIKLYAREFILIVHTCTSALFCVIGVIGMLTEPSWEMFGSLAFFSLCLTVFIPVHLQAPCLRLDYGGFVIDSGIYPIKVPWSAVAGFCVSDFQGRKVVGWRYLSDTDEYHQLSCRRGSVRGVHGCLHYTYGKKPEHLADLMNELCRSHRMTVQYLVSSYETCL